MHELTAQQLKDLRILARFIQVYCHAKHHRQNSGELALPQELQPRLSRHTTICPECAELLEHGIRKRHLCPLDPKPACKNCHIHCYGPAYRQKIREIMSFSGRKLLLRGRVDYLWHYFFN
ncbi:MAG TPA: nitrous oxide-stimulated promoter family protein [Geobacteraceae bacterium]|nr:nitrous oxide-stimulated promoter family protein [Geobacteraceae bacterium]